MRVIAVIPCYNEASEVGRVVQTVRSFVAQVIVVDDGSNDASAEEARKAGAVVVQHVINRGLGASLGTGFAAALMNGADAVVTLDADGQHDPSEIPSLVAALEAGADAALGSRMLTRTGMPARRQFANTLGNVLTFLLFGSWVTDSQSGYRAINASTLAKMDLKTNRMEVSSEIIAELCRVGACVVEVPIKAIYTEYSLSKGQNWFVGIKTAIKLLLRRLSS